jgi:hypothetical protein
VALADRLTNRLNAGAGSFKDALGHWLIPGMPHI